jgi:hypothetical protein
MEQTFMRYAKRENERQFFSAAQYVTVGTKGSCFILISVMT